MMSQPSRQLRDQLSPIAAKLREGRSVIRPVSQLNLRLKPTPGRDRFAATVDEILHWMNRRAGRVLPNAAWQRNSFELSEIGAQRTSAVALGEPKYWAARLDDSDKTVPLRTWVTEIGVGLDGNGDTLFGTRLICATRGLDEAFERSVPSFVKTIIAAGPVELDGVLVTKTARLVSTEADVQELLELLENPARLSDVIVVSLPEGSSNPTEAAIAAQEVHKKLLGIAHVVVITGPASYALSDGVGKELSVFRSGVRNYRPGFRAWLDDPSKHPLALPQRIEKWEEIGSSAFERWIVNQGLANSVRGAEREQQFPSFNTVRQLAAQVERNQLLSTGGSEAELLKLFDQDNEKLRKELKEQKEQDDGLLALAEAVILPPYFRTRAIRNVAPARCERDAVGQRDAA